MVRECACARQLAGREMERVRDLAVSQQRRVVAVIGSLVADAAGRTLYLLPHLIWFPAPSFVRMRVRGAGNQTTVCVAYTCDAAQPIHWVYQGMESVLEGLENPEFRPTSANLFYNIPTGQQSPYGDQLITTLESLVERNGENYVCLATS